MAGRSCSPPACASKASCTERPGQVAVEPEPAAHHVVARLREGDGARRVGGMQQRRRDAGRGQLRHQVVEQRRAGPRCRRGPPRSPSATGRWVQMPSSCNAGSATTAAAMARRSSGAAPTRCMPVSTLTWTATGRPAAAAAALQGGDPLGRVQRRREPVGQCRRRRGRIALAQQQHRRGDAVLAQLHPLVHQRHGEPARAAGQRGPGHRRPAVAVPVRLDDRAELGRSRPGGTSTAALCATAARSISAHAGRERPWAMVTAASSSAGTGATSRTAVRPQSSPSPDRPPDPSPRATPPPGRAGRRPPGPATGPSDAARPCTWAATAAASSAGSPRAQKAPMMPERTSPLPAVAKAGPAGRRQQHVGRRRRRRVRPPR